MTELVEQLVSEGHAVTTWSGRTHYYDKYNHPPETIFREQSSGMRRDWDPQWIWIGRKGTASKWATDGMNRWADRGLPWTVAWLPADE